MCQRKSFSLNGQIGMEANLISGANSEQRLCSGSYNRTLPWTIVQMASLTFLLDGLGCYSILFIYLFIKHI